MSSSKGRWSNNYPNRRSLVRCSVDAEVASLDENITAAPIQIKVDQTIHEAREQRQDDEIIVHRTELDDYRIGMRKKFENLIRKMGCDLSIRVWIKHARWEESQGNFIRARSVWERAFEKQVLCKNYTLWLEYAEFHMRHKFMGEVSRVLGLAVILFPEVDQLWFKYIHVEKMLGNVTRVRQIFQNWMDCMPDQQAWLSYINYELKLNEIQLARDIFERFVLCHPTDVAAWIYYAKFEMKNGEFLKMIIIQERAMDKLANYEEAKQLFLVLFAEIEPSCNEIEDFYELSLLETC